MSTSKSGFLQQTASIAFSIHNTEATQMATSPSSTFPPATLSLNFSSNEARSEGWRMHLYCVLEEAHHLGVANHLRHQVSGSLVHAAYSTRTFDKAKSSLLPQSALYRNVWPTMSTSLPPQLAPEYRIDCSTFVRDHHRWIHPSTPTLLAAWQKGLSDSTW